MNDREPLERTPAEEAEEHAFFALYGAWSPLEPSGVAELLAGFDRPWWIIGGWAIEAFTGHRREHEDVDLSILTADVASLRRALEPHWHLWNIHDAALRPLSDTYPDVADPASQIWIRRHATAPWVLDLPLTPDRDGLWTNKRWAEHIAPVEEVTWVAEDGIRYLAPEIVLHYKAHSGRPKDDRDFDRTWPLLDASQRAWLREAVATTRPGHPWFERVGGL